MADDDQTQTTADVAAIRTLERLGYTHSGGELWRPPLGKRPDFDLLDAKQAEIERLRAELADLREQAVDAAETRDRAPA